MTKIGSPTPAVDDAGLLRALGLWDSTLLVIGFVLGSAVFMVTGGPGGVASLLPAPGWLIVAWVVGGIVSFAGALVYAELGAALPRAGGQYVFLREAYGDLTGFLYGWTLFTVIHTGTLAALAVGYAEYFGFFFPALGTGRVVLTLPLFGHPLAISAGQLNAVFVIVLLSIVNYFGIKEGSLFQGIVTVVKLLSFAGFMVLGLSIGRGSASHFLPLFAPAGATAAGGSAAPGAAGGVGLGSFVLAMVAMLWAYEGWNNITFTAGEIKDPQRNLPRSLIFGMAAITLIYLGMNLLYLYAMPIEQMLDSTRIGEAAAGALFGPIGARLMALAVLISVFGCISATVISGPRVFYAMAKDDLFFKGIAEVHPRYRTPARAIFWQCVWSSVLCLSGQYDQLYTYVIFAAVLFYALAGAAVIVLRRRHPEWPRPYKTWGYPLTPILFVSVCLVVLANTLWKKPVESGIGLLILVCGLPAYLFWKRRKVRAVRAAQAMLVAWVLIAAPAVLAAGPETARTPGETAEPNPLFGFHHDAIEAQRRLEALLVSLPRSDRIERDAHLLTRAPHVAGTPENEAVARYIALRFEAAGLEVELKRYAVYLGYVRQARLEQIEPEPRSLGSPEDPIPGDDDTRDERAALQWNAYSPACDLTREVVFVHYGRPEDFELLERLGVEVKDRILLARYYHGYRGGKVIEARARGAAALLFYSDPADDGYVRGDPYPEGPWGPEGHVQRGATALDFLVPGDPLTPGWPSLPKAPRIRPEDAVSLPRLPSMPISGRDARVILAALRGPVVPAGWQGGLPLTYHLGPGPSRVHLAIDASFETRTITNVIGRLRGSQEPERSIVLGNHHDAWFYGAVDPISGTATMLELARVAGELARRGFRPRRTLVFGNWDGEEFTLTGSTEWGEERARDLSRNGVACLNVDSTIAGALSASLVPTMRRLLSEGLRDLQDPLTGRDLYTVTTAAAANAGESFAALYGATSAAPGAAAAAAVSYGLLGSGSDYTVFFNHLGIPSADLGFDGPYGVYHSVYDDHLWMSRFGDPGALYGIATVKLWGLLAYRLANADILPFEESPYVADVETYLADLEAQAGRRAGMEPLDLTDLHAALGAWRQAASAVDGAMTTALAGPRPDRQALRLANAALMQAERDLLGEGGLPGRPWYRHLIYAPLPSYAAETLPGLREAVASGDSGRARTEAARLAAALRARAKTVGRAAAALGVAAKGLRTLDDHAAARR